MKFIKLILLSTGLLCAHLQLNAQNYEDFALLFSQNSRGGTARILGIGGSATALGGDLSSAIINPAGLGFINRSEFTFSTQLDFLNSTSTYIGNVEDDFKLNFNIPQMGVVLKTSGNDSGFKGGSFGISVNRVKSFQNNVFYEGQNYYTDLNNFTPLVPGTFPDLAEFSVDDFANNGRSSIADLAFETYLVDEFFEVIAPGDTSFFVDRSFEFPEADFPVNQRESIETEGAQYQTNISYGANFYDKIYLGAGLGFTSINYRSTRVFTETPTDAILNSVTLTDIREITGVGFNATFGMIVRPINEVSLGVSYTTPTWTTLEDQGTLRMTTDFNNPPGGASNTNSSSIDFLPFSFDLRTPSKFNVGGAIFLGKNGFLTGDVEFINYESNRFSATGESFSFENDFIRENYQNVVNYRFGGEFRYEFLRFRAGYSHMGDPAEGLDDLDRSIDALSFGLGMRFSEYFADLAVVSSSTEASLSPYPNAPLVALDNESTTVTLTLGFKF